jgi:hypothetical protein
METPRLVAFKLVDPEMGEEDVLINSQLVSSVYSHSNVPNETFISVGPDCWVVVGSRDEVVDKLRGTLVKPSHSYVRFIANKIARDIMAEGDDTTPCQRIQFMCGKYPDNEIPSGGYSASALAGSIEESLRRYLPSTES